MKLHSDSTASSLQITAYDAHSVAIGERRLTSAFAITPQELIVELPAIAVQRLRWDALRVLHELDLEVLLIGTGSRQQFHDGDFYRDFCGELSKRRIGVEVMTSPAACRTFNILAADDRRVAALITFDHGADS